MITLSAPVGAHTATIRVPENQEDLEAFLNWLQAHEGEPIAVDTETTGLDIYSDDFSCRTVQVGIGLEAWVYILGDSHQKETLEAIFGDRELYFQNAAYDVLVLDRCFGYRCNWDKITDTKILAHLVDSRSVKEGGPGLSLQELTAFYIDKAVAEDIKGSMSRMSKETGLKKGELFATIDVFNETYLTYAGMDVILTWGLKHILTDKLHEVMARDPRVKEELVRYEHDVARVCAEMVKNGFLLDVEYTEKLAEKLQEEQDVWEAIAYNEYGLESVNSNAEVADFLIEDGVKLTELTATGAYKVNKEVIEPLLEQGNLLAQCVTEAKRAKKWRTSWVDKFLAGRDNNNRCHANIQPLQARTARMSVSGIPVQQLPSSDWSIRRCFIPDEGQVIVSCDYQAQELRVLAALSGDENMIRAFKEDADLHQITADASGVDRKVGKTVNFAYVYGSGPSNIAKTCGITTQKAREVIKGFERTYPRVKQLSERLQRQAIDLGYVVTPFGRRLLVDKDRPYAALNYMIQSTSRDITANALLRLDKEGFTPYLRLPIHDEVVASIPEEHAEWGSQRIAELMATDFGEVHIGTDAEVYGKSWGGGYYDKENADDAAAYERTFS